MDRLNFNTRVLGEKASKRLQELHGGFLTLRSQQPHSPDVEVYLDDKLLGIAKIHHAIFNHRVNLGSLTHQHATMGGFDTVGEQARALGKAGYRFKPLDKYEAYVVYFIGDWGNKEGQ